MRRWPRPKLKKKESDCATAAGACYTTPYHTSVTTPHHTTPHHTTPHRTNHTALDDAITPELVALGLWAALGTVRAEMQLHMLPADKHNATCTDDSPVGYYFEPDQVRPLAERRRSERAGTTKCVSIDKPNTIPAALGHWARPSTRCTPTRAWPFRTQTRPTSSTTM